jgi:hypothetical protein
VGLDHVRFHDLRHFVATRLLAGGVDLRTVAGRLGHSTAGVTLNVYAAFVPDADHRAADVMASLLAANARVGCLDAVTRTKTATATSGRRSRRDEPVGENVIGSPRQRRRAWDVLRIPRVFPTSRSTKRAGESSVVARI